MYFDDACIQDWASAEGRGQLAVRTFMELLGTPFAPSKQQDMSLTGDFLGLEHNLTDTAQSSTMTVWARGRIVENILAMIQEGRQAGSLPPGTAAKLYGTANFFELGVFGKVGRAGLNPIRNRQYENRAKDLTPAIEAAFDLLEAIITERPQRLLHVGLTVSRRFVVASDAAYEKGAGTGGFLCVHQDDAMAWQKSARVVVIPQAVYGIWSEHCTYIAQLELLMVLAGIVELASTLRGMRGVSYIDNIAALMALVRGRSDSRDLDSLARIIHCALFSLRTWIYFEWIESAANWADGISRTPPMATLGVSGYPTRFEARAGWAGDGPSPPGV